MTKDRKKSVLRDLQESSIASAIASESSAIRDFLKSEANFVNKFGARAVIEEALSNRLSMLNSARTTVFDLEAKGVVDYRNIFPKDLGYVYGIGGDAERMLRNHPFQQPDFESLSSVLNHSALNSYQEIRALELKAFVSFRSVLENIPLITRDEIDDPDVDDIEALQEKQINDGDEAPSGIIIARAIPLQLLKRILKNPEELNNISPREFEESVAQILEGLGYEGIILTQASKDGGKDIIARKNIDGIPLTFYFECKRNRRSNKVKLSTIRSLLGVVTHESQTANMGVLVTTSTFTAGARKLISSDARVDGKDYRGLLAWIEQVRRTK